MVKHKFDSDLIAGVTYDAEKKRLEVRYTDHTVFHYFQVPADIAHRIETAKSAGHFWVTRRDQFPHRRIS